MRVRVRAVLFPARKTPATLLAAALAWLAVPVLALSLFGVALVISADQDASDHGGSAFAFGGVLFAGLLVAVALVVRWVDEARPRWVRLAGAAALVAGAWLSAFYPLAYIRDPYSLPLAAAVIFAILTVLQLAATAQRIWRTWRTDSVRHVLQNGFTREGR